MKYIFLAWAVLVTFGAFAKATSWSHRFAVAVDILTASIVWSTYDVTISSRCGWALRVPTRWNFLLCWLGVILNHVEKNHCELAIQADRDRALLALAFLGGEK